jgi:hypothetical protein
MKYAALALLVAGALALAPGAVAKVERSREVAAQFQHEHPCPSTGKTRGVCPGYVKDHINPLCNGGSDTVTNMAWQTVADAKEKDKWERSICRAKRKGLAG